MTPSELTARLRTIRRDLGIRQLEIARALGVTPAAVSRWEHGVKAPSLQHLAEWARQLGHELTLTD